MILFDLFSTISRYLISDFEEGDYCNYMENEGKVHIDAWVIISSLTAIFSLVANMLYSYALYQMKMNNTLSNGDKLFLTQSVLDMGSLLYLISLTTLQKMSNDLCSAPVGWTLNQMRHYQEVIEVIRNMPVAATCMPLIISVTRYVHVHGRSLSRSTKIIHFGVAIVVIATMLTSGIVATASLWTDKRQMRITSIIVFHTSKAAILILLITTNSLLLKHVLASAMPTASRTHKNEH